ncbi:MAG: FG-GAP-like repeat-containing protein, partial [Candidatus Zixiibacteriota bacterium]
LAFISAIGPLFVYYNYGDSIERYASWNSGGYYDGNTLNWGDMDDDGWLDLAVANNDQLGPPGYFEVYHNVNGTLNTSPIWRSSTEGYGSSVSWCDVDNDGDKDLAAGRWWGYSVIYENTGGDLTNSPTWSSTNSEVVEEMVWADIDGDGVLNVVGEVHAGDGVKKVFYLNHYPAHSLERVIVDSDTLELTEFCCNLAGGWVSLATSPVSDMVVDYHYSHKPDLGVSNWGGANFIFRNVAPAYVWGDANGGGDVEVGDIVYLVNYLYKGGLEPVPSQCGDPNDDCVINVADIVYLLNYLYRGGDAPLPGCAG